MKKFIVLAFATVIAMTAFTQDVKKEKVYPDVMVTYSNVEKLPGYYPVYTFNWPGGDQGKISFEWFQVNNWVRNVSGTITWMDPNTGAVYGTQDFSQTANYILMNIEAGYKRLNIVVNDFRHAQIPDFE